MENSRLFHQLVNLVDELEERDIQDTQTIKAILLRESMKFLEVDNDLHLFTPIGQVKLTDECRQIDLLWQVIDDCLDVAQ